MGKSRIKVDYSRIGSNVLIALSYNITLLSRMFCNNVLFCYRKLYDTRMYLLYSLLTTEIVQNRNKTSAHQPNLHDHVILQLLGFDRLP